jgi:hypothetical protein
MQYEDRYVALIDIIGFSSWVLSDKTDTCAATLTAIYAEIRKALLPYEERVSPGWIQATLFSDTIVLSTRVRPGDTRTEHDVISQFLWCVRKTALILLKHGFLARGCVLEDRLHHDEVLVVGPAIITAHEYESKVAKYPRILVIRTLREKMQQDEKLKMLLRKSADGLRYLHVLHEFQKFFCNVPEIGEQNAEQEVAFRFALESRHTIDRSLSAATDTPEHFEKVRWFADYFNGSVSSVYKAQSKTWLKPLEIDEYY